MTPHDFYLQWRKAEDYMKSIYCNNNIVLFANDYSVIREDDIEKVVLRFIFFYLPTYAVTIGTIPLSEITGVH